MIRWPESDDFNNRLLICDDNKAIHKDFQKVLGSSPRISHIQAIEDELFDEDPTYMKEEYPATDIQFQIDSAYQGQEALRMIEDAHAEGKPYAVVFMDVRMPPGWDGILTTEKIWEKFPDTEIVIVTAYSDYTWDEMISKLGISKRLLFIKKPFDSLSVKQIALNLTTRWNESKNSEARIRELEEALSKLKG